MAPSWLKILLVVLLIVLLFGRGKIAGAMGDFAKGIKNFKRELTGGEPDEPAHKAPGGDADKRPNEKV